MMRDALLHLGDAHRVGRQASVRQDLVQERRLLQPDGHLRGRHRARRDGGGGPGGGAAPRLARRLLGRRQRPSPGGGDAAPGGERGVRPRPGLRRSAPHHDWRRHRSPRMGRAAMLRQRIGPPLRRREEAPERAARHHPLQPIELLRDGGDRAGAGGGGADGAVMSTNGSIRFDESMNILYESFSLSQIESDIARFKSSKGLPQDSDIVFAQYVGGYSSGGESPSVAIARALSFSQKLDSASPELLASAATTLSSSNVLKSNQIIVRFTFATPAKIGK